MGQWETARTRLVEVKLHLAAAQSAMGAPGGELEIEPGPHVGASYQVVVGGGRVVHEGGLTLHGPAAQAARALPDDLAAAVETLWRHAQEAVAEHEQLAPPGAIGPDGA